MPKSPVRPLVLVSLPTLALALVAFSSGQQAHPAVGGSVGATTGTTSSTTGSTGSTSGSTSGSTGGAITTGWTLTGSTDGETTHTDGSQTSWLPANYGTSTDIGGHDPNAGNVGPGSWSADSTGNATLSVNCTGGGTAPAYAWVLVTSTANWGSDSGGGSASDAFGDQQSGLHVSSGRRVFRIVSGGSKVWGLTASYFLSLSGGQMAEPQRPALSTARSVIRTRASLDQRARFCKMRM